MGMSLTGYRVSGMDTLNESFLAVSLNLPKINSIRRNAKLETDRNGFQFVVYTGERTEVELKPEFIPELLKLVNPGGDNPSENAENNSRITLWAAIDPIQAIDFLNRWGVIGLVDDNELLYGNLTPAAMSQTLTPKSLGEKKVKKLISLNGELDPEYVDRAVAMLHGDQVLYSSIESQLYDLARCARLVTNLRRSDSKPREKFSLTVDNRRRLLAAWDMAPFPIPDDKDPAKYRKMNKAWLGDWGPGSQWGEGYNLTDAEFVVADFATFMNAYLAPLSSMIVRTPEIEDDYQKNLCFETACATYLLDRLRNGGVLLLCEKCRHPYFPNRLRLDGKWCSYNCGSAVRNRERRKRDKMMSQTTKKLPKISTPTRS